jgi:putative iron-dependent peroxidase
VLASMAGAVTVVDEVHGFRFFEQRDLLGFVDGTENPDGPEAVEAVQIGAEDDDYPDFEGASYVHVQKYTHDMTAWNALSVNEQELVIGRTKLEDIEMSDEDKPANSHLALNVIEDADGNELQIVRANMPFGTLGGASGGESGTYYIAYAADPAVTERMLRNMFIGDPPGNTDRILDFSTAVTGTMYFVPTADFLDDPPPLPDGETEPVPVAPATTSTPTGSLSIGSLKGQPQ